MIKQVFINSEGITNGIVHIYDILGNQVVQSSITNEGLNIMNLLCGPGVYLVKVHAGQEIYTEKIFIR